MNELVQPAKQERSRETLDRILRATETLLAQESFESISIRRIVKTAESSIGSFYARFRDKDALLPLLYAQYETQLQKRLRKLQQTTAKAASLEQVAILVARHFIGNFGEKPNLSRALYEYVTRTPEAADSGMLAAQRRQQYAFLFDALLRFRAEITHPDPPRAVELGLYFLVVTCRNRLLYPLGPQTRTVKISQRDLEPELVRLLTGYLKS